MIKSTKTQSYGGLSMVPSKSTTNKRTFKHLTEYEFESSNCRHIFLPLFLKANSTLLGTPLVLKFYLLKAS